MYFTWNVAGIEQPVSTFFLGLIWWIIVPVIYMTSDEIGIIPNLSLEDIFDTILPIFRFGEPTDSRG